MSKKGPPFERAIAVRLSEWWSGGKTDDIFWRTANSGGRATVRHRRGKRAKGIHGDLMATDPDGQSFIDTFLIELKNGYSHHTPFDLVNPYKKNSCVYEKWITKAEESVKKCEALTWLIIHKRDGRKPIVVFKNYMMKAFASALSHSSDALAVLRPNDESYVVWDLEDFLCFLRPGDIRKEAERRSNAARRTHQEED